MPKQLGKGIDKEAMFKKIMPSASKPQNTAAAFNPDADGFSASPSQQNAADALDLDGDFGSLDMLDSLGSFDALDSFDLFDESDLPRKAAPKKTAKAPAAKKAAAKSPAKPATKTASKASAKAAAKSRPAPPPDESAQAQAPADPARARAQMPFPINTTAPLAAPAAPTASIAPEELDLPFAAPPAVELPAHDKPPLPFPINTSAPMAAPAAPTAPVPPPVSNEFTPSPNEGYQLDTQFDLMDSLAEPPQNYAIPGGAIPPRTPDPIQPQAIQQPGLPAQQMPALSQPLMPQEIMAQTQQQLMQQMQQMYQQMQQQFEQQMQQQLQQQKMLQQQLEQQLAVSAPIAATTPPPNAVSLPPSPTEAPPAVSETPSGNQDVAVAASIEPTEEISAPVPIDPLALMPVNLSAMQLTPRLDDMIERLRACNCEQCKLDTVAFALNQLPVHYTLSGQVTEEDLCNRTSVSQVVSALCHAVLFVKSHPRH